MTKIDNHKMRQAYWLRKLHIILTFYPVVDDDYNPVHDIYFSKKTYSEKR